MENIHEFSRKFVFNEMKFGNQRSFMRHLSLTRQSGSWGLGGDTKSNTVKNRRVKFGAGVYTIVPQNSESYHEYEVNAAPKKRMTLHEKSRLRSVIV